MPAFRSGCIVMSLDWRRYRNLSSMKTQIECILGDELYWFLWKAKKFPYLRGGRMYLESQCVTFLAFVMHLCHALHIMHYAWLSMSHYHMLRYIRQKITYLCNTYWQQLKRPLKHKTHNNTMWHLDLEIWQKSQQCKIRREISDPMAFRFYRI